MFRYVYSGGAKLNFRATAALKSGQVLILGKLVTICPFDIPVGEAVGLQLDGVFEADATAAESWAIGDALYVIVATGLLTKTATGNTFFGYAESVKDAGATKGQAILIQRSPAPA